MVQSYKLKDKLPTMSGNGLFFIGKVFQLKLNARLFFYLGF
ncbi:hypothetical protein ADICYQ_0614 [Cyclobacterium qasimii M12-11B]|uniref:Uncharacterized protein n=1 Tax=Cyclobacterium qasimii M12-11B TaxID=641524 RepID=S7X4J7_9BACT|nr:hypothetical protein ADICYQ_0614 [Cyclobacterium qasimii M12-11B]